MTVPPPAASPTWTNWAGTAVASPAEITTVRDAAHVAEVVRGCARDGRRVKAIGSGHSFTAIGVTDGMQLQMSAMNRVLDIDHVSRRVRVEAGMTIRRLNRILDAAGLALPNLGDIDEQTVSGAVSTSTHGTGGRLFGIAAAVVGVQLVTADGEVLDIDEDHAWFRAAQVSLGALGVVTALTLQCVPAFLLHAREEPARVSRLIEDLDSHIDGHDHFEFYWWPHTDGGQAKFNDRVPDGTEARPLSRARRLIDDEILANGALEVMCRAGRVINRAVPLINRLGARALSEREYTASSHSVFVSPRRVRFREMEYAFDRAVAVDLLRDVRAFLDRHDEAIGFPIEVRFTAADDAWLSTSYGRDSVYIAAHVYHRTSHTRYFAGLEEVYRAYGGRPHWGKMHTLDTDDLRPRYPHFDDFRGVRDALDPERVFTNPYLDRVLGP